MNITQIEEKVKELVTTFDPSTFIYELLDAYGKPKASISRLKVEGTGGYNLSKEANTILWKNQLYYQSVKAKDLHSIIDEAHKSDSVAKHSPRFIIVTNNKDILAIDTKTKDTLDSTVSELHRKFDFFLPWAGLEKSQSYNENPADVKAAEKMAKLFDLLRDDNDGSDAKSIHALNVFLSRILFCLFAEDTGIFSNNRFTNSIESHTQEDGSDLSQYLTKLFAVLNLEESKRKNIPDYLNSFQYVNGGLFADNHKVPNFSRKSRKMLIECGAGLNWSEINPDIFGSMIQAVVHPDQRGNMGMHYTSVPNIMKVIEPLFLTELRGEYDKYRDNKAKLEQLLFRLEHIKVFDPACGSGNFLIIAYREIRNLEMMIFKTLQELSKEKLLPFSRISLTQFYGIELDDFAHEVALLSLWLAEHQMNVKFKATFGHCPAALPLKQSGNIVCANATRVNWLAVCPHDKNGETYVLGNPPYLGSRRQTEEQTEDIKSVFGDDYKSVDYICAWFHKGAKFIETGNAKLAFVTTNSICQGEQVALAWPKILGNSIEIGFCHSEFKWTNSAKANAAVIVTIIGLRKISDEKKFIYADGYTTEAKDINPYLVDAPTIYVHSRSNPLGRVPEMNFGNMPADGGKLLFTKEEKDTFIKQEPKAKKWFKPLISAREYLNGIERWCLWLVKSTPEEIREMPLVQQRVKELKKIREESSRPQLANIPHLFAQVTQPSGENFILIPRHSSENRDYIPISHFDMNNVAHDSCLIVASDSLALFGLLTSRMHMVWMRAVAGRLKTDYRYSKEVVYNTFPFPNLSKASEEKIVTCVMKLVEARENHSEKTLAEQYDPEKMPADLLEAHNELDQVVDRCYRAKIFESDAARLSVLFDLYLSKTQGK